jgi:ribosomal protein L9
MYKRLGRGNMSSVRRIAANQSDMKRREEKRREEKRREEKRREEKRREEKKYLLSRKLYWSVTSREMLKIFCFVSSPADSPLNAVLQSKPISPKG